MKRTLIMLATALAVLPLSFHSALAVGGGASEATQCNSGWVWDKEKKKCVPEESSSLDDGDLLDSGIALAYAGRHDDAIRALNLVSDKNDPEVWNFLGYSTRKSGKLAEGLVFYEKALSIDPDYTLARAYMGEAWLTIGDRAKAVAQLREIERRDGREGKAHVYLASALNERRQY